MRTVRSAAGAAVSGGRVYIAGGSSGAIAHSTVESFSTRAHPITSSVLQYQWRTDPPLSVARMAMSLTATEDGSLWATGGWTHEGGATDTVESLTRDADAWVAAPSMITARCSFGAAEVGGVVLALGGSGDAGPIDACESFDPRVSTWCALPPMSRRGSCLTAAPLGQHRVLVCGGHDGTLASAGAEIFDRCAGRWEAVPDMPTARSGLTAVHDRNGRVWVIGGYPDGTAAGSDARALNTVEVWDDAARCWSKEADMQCGRTGMCAVALSV